MLLSLEIAVILVMAFCVAWPREMVLLTGRGSDFRPLAIEDDRTTAWLRSMRDVRLLPHDPPRSGRHRAGNLPEPHVQGRPLYRPGPPLTPVAPYTEAEAFDSTAVGRLRAIVAEQHEEAETMLSDLPAWARNPQQAPLWAASGI